MSIEWDEVFVTGVVSKRITNGAVQGSDIAKAIACATALVGWGNCMTGSQVPEKFGVGMMALADWAGLSVSDLQHKKAGETADKALKAIAEKEK